MIPVYQPWLTDLEKSYAYEAISSGWISSNGPYNTQLEEEFADYIGVKHAITVNTGTAACHLALAALKIGELDNVVIPGSTFVATANAVKYCNAAPNVIDIDKETWNIDTSKLETALDDLTTVIMPVHLYGNPCDLSKILHHKENRYVVEDAAEALGATYNGGKVGSFGHLACFSFYGNKTIAGGEGGMVVTDSDHLAHRCRLLRGQGQTSTYYHTEIGFNYRMTNIVAAIILAQLRRIDVIQTEKQRVAEGYKHHLTDAVQFQSITANSTHSNWMIVIRSPKADKIKQQLTEAEIEWRPAFYPINSLPPYHKCAHTPEAEKLHNEGIMLPSYPQLTDQQIRRISETILRSVDA